jgi:hypothetical protein
MLVPNGTSLARSSASTVPAQQDFFQKLPADVVVGKIVPYGKPTAPPGDFFPEFQTQHKLGGLNKRTKTTIERHPRYQLLSHIYGLSRQLCWEAANPITRFQVPLLLINPQARIQLVNEAIDLPNEFDKSKAIVELSQGLEHLPVAQRAQLVTEAIGLKHKTAKADAIAGLSQGLGHLTVDQQVQLVDMAISLPYQPNRCPAPQAIKELGQGLLRLLEQANAGAVSASFEASYG